MDVQNEGYKNRTIEGLKPNLVGHHIKAAWFRYGKKMLYDELVGYYDDDRERHIFIFFVPVFPPLHCHSLLFIRP